MGRLLPLATGKRLRAALHQSDIPHQGDVPERRLCTLRRNTEKFILRFDAQKGLQGSGGLAPTQLRLNENCQRCIFPSSRCTGDRAFGDVGLVELLEQGSPR